MSAPDAPRAAAEGDLSRIAAIRAAEKAGHPVDLEITENVAQWCVFLGDQLDAPKMILTAAAAIRAQANEIRKLRAAPLANVLDPDDLRDAVVAAALAWREARKVGIGSMAQLIAIDGLERAVDAYEAATGGLENG